MFTTRNQWCLCQEVSKQLSSSVVTGDNPTLRGTHTLVFPVQATKTLAEANKQGHSEYVLMKTINDGAKPKAH